MDNEFSVSIYIFLGEANQFGDFLAKLGARGQDHWVSQEHAPSEILPALSADALSLPFLLAFPITKFEGILFKFLSWFIYVNSSL